MPRCADTVAMKLETLLDLLVNYRAAIAIAVVVALVLAVRAHGTRQQAPPPEWDEDEDYYVFQMLNDERFSDGDVPENGIDGMTGEDEDDWHR